MRIFCAFVLLAAGLSHASSTCPDKVIQYGGQTFQIPVLSDVGFVLHPEAVDLSQDLLQREEVKACTSVWNFNRLMECHQPVLVGSVPEPGIFEAPGMVSSLDMPIKFPGTGYWIPENYRQLEGAIKRMIAVEHGINPRALQDYYAYLTVHQSVVEPGNYQRRPGLHVDGFQGVERPQKELIEHSYFTSNSVPTVFTKQKFLFTNFDFSRFNVFTEFDRQNLEQYEFKSEPFQIYLANAYAVHRADRATQPVLRTFVRLTYSVAIFDRLGLTDNPLFPYRWERREKTLQQTLERYTPPLGTDRIPQVADLEVPGTRIGVIGVGEGSDGVQAAQLGELLRRRGKVVPFLLSCRLPSENIGGYKVDATLVKVTPEFKMASRTFEAALANDFSTYVSFAQSEEALTVQLRELASKYQVDSLLLVDSGGNILSPAFIQENTLNDHRTLFAAAKVEVAHKTLAIVAPGLNSPANLSEILAAVSAVRYRPRADERESILNNFIQWKMGYPQPSTFAFVPMVWQQALKGEFGPQSFPTLYPNDPRYIVTPETQDLLLAPLAGVRGYLLSDSN